MQMRNINVKWIFVCLSFFVTTACGTAATNSGSNATTTGDSLQSLANCEAQTNGTICGTLYAPDGTTPLANAQITELTSSNNLSLLSGNALTADTSACTSDATGGFACVCNTSGESLTFHVDSALIDFDFTANCVANDVTNVPAATTTANSDEITRLAVVTGSYDKVEVLLADMFDCGTVTDGELDYGTECETMHIYDGGARIYGDTDPNNGNAEYRTVEDLLSNPDLMADYDLIFLNCGLDDTLSLNATVIANIQDYIANGGHIYASDWAYRFIEEAFPAQINFYGSTDIDGLSSSVESDEARVGNSDDAQPVTINDTSLLTYLRANEIIGADDTTASVEFDLGSWVVMSDADDSVDQLLTADSLEGIDDAVLDGNDTLPIATLSCDESGGGVFYGSYHTEIGEATSADDAQEAILRYMILNGFNSCES